MWIGSPLTPHFIPETLLFCVNTNMLEERISLHLETTIWIFRVYFAWVGIVLKVIYLVSKKGENVGTGKLLVSQGPSLRRRGCLALAFSPSGVSIPTHSSSRPGSVPGAFRYSGTFVKLREVVRRVHVITHGDCESESFSNFPKSQFLRSRALPIRVSQSPWTTYVPVTSLNKNS